MNWKDAEKLACDYLNKKQYTILYYNHKIYNTQIDIIAKYDNIIIGVEVKLRKNKTMFPLTYKQYYRIINALSYEYHHHLIRLDLIIINHYYNIEHIENIVI